MILRQIHNIPQTIMKIGNKNLRSSLLDDPQLSQVIDPCVQTTPLIPLQIRGERPGPQSQPRLSQKKIMKTIKKEKERKAKTEES